MKNFIKHFIVLITFISLFGCPSDDDDCMKTITIPQYYISLGQSYSYDTTLEVPCDFAEPEEPQLIEPPILENFSFEILNFNFTPDTGNNTSRLQFQIKLNNSNNYSINGVPIITMNSDGLEYSGSFSKDASVPCYQIDANSDCILTYDKESSLDLGIINSIQIIKVAYYLTN
ncbi:RNA polymerase II transcription elongation factor [Lutibacter agarilyticus]|uniref:RNA polymerase II transcription elongation factor n=1 Tax=Lutibacter agarilyticus TaxID=1109740 RepID=A0A238XHE4_9FLAO|nr:hypothetical protein [Lutibacter agarilyticus]SNR57764.1 RNA polymerase II transcription elongation factor [Lutibacter agarilyticus]